MIRGPGRHEQPQECVLCVYAAVRVCRVCPRVMKNFACEVLPGTVLVFPTKPKAFPYWH